VRNGSAGAQGQNTRLFEYDYYIPCIIDSDKNKIIQNPIIKAEKMKLKSLFGRGQEKILGLDMSSWGIKVVGLSGSVEQPVLEVAACTRLPSGSIVGGHILKLDDVAQAIRFLLREQRVAPRKVAVALPSSAVIIKKIMAEGDLSPSDLQAHVEEEARQFMPFPLEELSLDYCIVGVNRQRADMVDVLIAAARRNRVQELQDLAETAELEACVVEVQSYALWMATKRLADRYVPDQPNPVALLLKVGAARTLMQLAVGDIVVYEREQIVGGDQLTQRIAAHYGISMEKAEIKKVTTAVADGFARSLLEPYISACVLVLERGMQFIRDSTAVSKIDHIFLSGGGALVPGLPDALEKALQARCTLMNPFEAMRLAPQIRNQPALQQAPLFVGACGLALRGLVR